MHRRKHLEKKEGKFDEEVGDSFVRKETMTPQSYHTIIAVISERLLTYFTKYSSAE